MPEDQNNEGRGRGARSGGGERGGRGGRGGGRRTTQRIRASRDADAPADEPEFEETEEETTEEAEAADEADEAGAGDEADDGDDDGEGDDADGDEGDEGDDDGDEGDEDEGGEPAQPQGGPQGAPQGAPQGGGQRLDYRSMQKLPQDKIETFAKAQQFATDKRWSKAELVYQFYKHVVEKMSRGLTLSKGVLEILPEGYGFLRTKAEAIDDADVYVSQSQVRRFGLRTGDEVVGQVRPPKDNESYFALIKVEEVNGDDPEKFLGERPIYEKLVPLYPFERIKLERKDPKILDVRLLDLVTPVGKGQRGLIVAPPKAGKTTLIKSIANSIAENHPEIELIILLIDERPEEVTDMERGVRAKVVASCFDEPVANHIRVTEMVLEMCKRKVEMGKDVVILMDSITRLARAYNISVPSSGQTLSGGVNPHSLYKPKRFFGSARKIENGGSLTILATALVETGNKMDDFIYEEFKGTGNMELILDRDLFHKRIFPSVNIKLSSTRKDELLVPEEVLRRMHVLRRVLASMHEEEALTMMIKHLSRTESNYEFLASLNKATALE